MATLTIDLPDQLLSEARAAGLLAPGVVEAMLRDRLRRGAVDDLFEAADKLAEARFPVMTMAEIQEEVDAVRSQRRRRATGA